MDFKCAATVGACYKDAAGDTTVSDAPHARIGKVRTEFRPDVLIVGQFAEYAIRFTDQNGANAGVRTGAINHIDRVDIIVAQVACNCRPVAPASVVS